MSTHTVQINNEETRTFHTAGDEPSRTNHEEKWGNLEADVFMMRQIAKHGTGNLHFDNDGRNRDRIDAHKALERMGFTETKIEGGMFYVKFAGDAWITAAE